MKMGYRTIVFTDLDDTLVNRGTFTWEAMKQTFAQRFNVEVSLDEIANAIGHDTLTKKYNCDWLTFWRAFDMHDNREEAMASGKIKLYTDAPQFMKIVSAIADIVVTTDTPPHKSLPEIMTLGLSRYISGTAAYILGHRTLKYKPDISVALRAFRVAEYKPERTENKNPTGAELRGIFKPRIGIARPEAELRGTTKADAFVYKRRDAPLCMEPNSSNHRSSSRTKPDQIWVIGDGLNDMEFAENIKRYVSENGFDAVVRSIYIHRRGPTDIKHDYRTFGPNPLLTAAKVILSHNLYYKPKAPTEVCWSETAIMHE